MRSPLRVLFLSSLVACAGDAADSGSGAPGGGADGGGNVGFGGAQDIGQFRGILDRGEIPGPETLDANGFFNEHFVEPAPVNCTGVLCINAGLSVGKDWLTGGYQAALQIAVSTHVDPSTYTRLPMNLVVVVDHSGSMAADNRLVKVKAGLDTLIDNLKPEDRLALIAFDDVVTQLSPFGATLDRPALHAAVATLQPRGGTNIHDGLRAGLELLGDAPQSDKQNRVIFLSDGLATVGNTSQEAIIGMATQRIARGIGLTTIGVGNDFDAPLMRGLAERGAGNFYYIEDSTAANEVFTKELEYFMSPLALDIQIDATAAAGWDFRTVVGSTLWQAQPRSGKMNVPAVFLASRIDQNPDPGGGRRGGGSMIFIALAPTAHEAGKVADLKLSYRLPGTAERITDTIVLDYNRDPQETPDAPYLSYPDMAERYAMYNMFLGFKLATEHAVQNWNCAASALVAARASAQTWYAAHEADQDLGADIVLADKFLANLTAKGAVTTYGLDRCSNGNPYPGGGDGWGDDDYHGNRACSAGRGNGWLALVAVAFLAARRRRR
jgi:Ca-activated chloride channel homolog